MTDPNSELLASRYGQNSGMSKRVKRLLAGLGVGLATITAAYFGWANYTGLEYQEISFSIIDSKSVELTFEIAKPQDRTAICNIQALNEQFGVVGYKSLEIAAQQAQRVRVTTSINTTELATTALVDDCRLK